MKRSVVLACAIAVVAVVGSGLSTGAAAATQPGTSARSVQPIGSYPIMILPSVTGGSTPHSKRADEPATVRPKPPIRTGSAF